MVAPNAKVAPLINIASAHGINFTSTEIAVLNEQGQPMINKIKDLIQTFNNSVKTDFGNLMKNLTGKSLNSKEIEALDAIADNIDSYKFLMRLMYAANAYAAETTTAVKYNAIGSKCSHCKANAFKHALFLIYNAETFTLSSANTLASAHEYGQVGIDTEMDKKNNAAGSSIFSQFNGSGTSSQWADRVKLAANLGKHGLVFIKNSVLVSTTNFDPDCP